MKKYGSTIKIVGANILVLCFIQILMMIHLKNNHRICENYTVDIIFFLGFPITLIIVGTLALWVSKLKCMLEMQKDAVEEDRDDMMRIFNSMEAIVEIVDIKTYEIMYINNSFVRIINEVYDTNKTWEDFVGKKCYEQIEGKNCICEHCSVPMIIDDPEETHTWEFYRPEIKVWWRLTEKLITWKDKKCKLTIGYDITEDKKKFAAHELSEHRLTCMIESLTDCCALFEPDDHNKCKVKATEGWKRVLYNGQYRTFFEQYSCNLDDPCSCIFPVAMRKKLVKMFNNAFSTGKRNNVMMTFKKQKLSFYVYKANHGVMVSIRKVKS